MKVGVFGGGFKPFTTGHFSMLSVALQENDLVVLFYAMSARKKGSDFQFTKEMGRDIFAIVKPALERTYGDRIRVEPGLPNPIIKIFDLISAIRSGVDAPSTSLTELGIDPESVDRMTVYSDDQDIKKFTNYLGTPKEKKYFGNLVRSGRLVFDSWDSDEGGSIERVVSAMRNMYPELPDDDLSDIITVRGSVVRSLIGTRDRNRLARYLPDFLNQEEKDEIIAILFRGLAESYLRRKSILREYIQSVVKAPINEALEAHILNFYEDLEMPIGELFEVIDAVVEGKLENVQEKMDGQNVTFSVVDGELVFFSKGATWRRVQKGGINRHAIEAKYQHIPSVRDAFLMAYDALSSVIQHNPSNAQELFQNGQVLISAELLAPKNPNTIVYEEPHIRFIKPEAVGPDAEIDQAAYNKFVRDAEKAKERLEQQVNMGAVPLLKLKRSLAADDDLADEIRSDLEELLSSTGMSPNDTIGDLAVHLLAKKLKHMDVPESILEKVAFRLATGTKSALTKKEVVAAEGIDAWRQLQALEKKRRTLLGEVLVPIERIVQKIGVLAFRHMEFALASNDRTAGEDLRRFVSRVRRAFETGHILADPVQLEKIRVALKRIGANEEMFEKAVEGIVFQWKGKTRKLTGLFTPINKLRGFFVYGKEPAKIQDKTEESLRHLIRQIVRG